jgi:hypothetical protein
MGKNPNLRVMQTAANGTAPPRKLGNHGMALWNRVMSEYDVADSGGRELLAQACLALDRAESLRETIARDGEFVSTRAGGLREHPGLKPELAARAFVVKTLCRLGLHVEPVRSGPGRPGSGVGWSGE